MNLLHNAESQTQCEILDALPALIFLERAGRIVYANAEALHVMGVAGTAWTPRRTEEVLWGLFPGIAEPRTDLTGGCGGSPFHATLAGKGGRIIAVEGTYCILNADLREGIIVAQVSARERAPKPRLMEDVLASLPEAVAIVHGGRVLYVNQSFTQMFGYAEEEASGRNLRDLIVPETRHHENAMLQRVVEEQGRAAVETVRMHKSGDLVDVALQVAPLMVNSAAAGYVLTFRDIGQRKQVEAQLQQDAMHDVLTGLPNFALFEDRLKMALSRCARNREQNCGVVLIDLDGFEALNENLGHAAGDMLLMSTAGRLRATLRPQDTAARVDGDEFAILVEGISAAADLEVVVQRVMVDLERPFDLLGHRIQLGASAGVAMSADQRSSVEAMMQDARSALFEVKQAGGGRYQIFDRGSEVHVPELKRRERQLRQALDKQEFELWYQPMFRLATGNVEGFEALPRWRRADGSIDMLRDLHPIAEDAGFVRRVGRNLLEKVCAQLQSWAESTSGACPFLSVNLTRRQFYQDDLIPQVTALLIATGADPSKLMFEVPESAVSDNSDRAIAVLQRLVDCGVRVALDNFGAGVAPVNHLVRLPLHLVKLDANLTLMAEEPGRHVVLLESLIHIAKSAGVQMLAQGVQTYQQLTLLQELGCELGQGQLLSAVLEPAKALQLAASTRPTMALNA